jgi:hypothetical protein
MTYEGRSMEYDCSTYASDGEYPDDDVTSSSLQIDFWDDDFVTPERNYSTLDDSATCLIVRQGSCSSQSIATAAVATSLHIGCGCVANGKTV